MATKISISNDISKNLTISLNLSKSLVDKFILVIIKNCKSNKVKISGFGTFYTHKSPERIGRNPKTKDSYIISPRKKLNFKLSNKIKTFLND
tara:strand:- start:551 stop:826 length:276 start_codon:yes stop_codon:yes gene_type:complete